jgi:hypothetical protein
VRRRCPEERGGLWVLLDSREDMGCEVIDVVSKVVGKEGWVSEQ